MLKTRFTRLCKLTLLAGCSLYGLHGVANAQDTTAAPEADELFVRRAAVHRSARHEATLILSSVVGHLV